jgi:very-short-patch-repair endonuclease
MTYCEKVLWQELRKNRLHNLYFRRQHPISHFIVDFYCHELRLVIEVDGSIHDMEEQRERDLNRTAEIEKFDIAFNQGLAFHHRPSRETATS